ncbi:8-oxo-dGTP pyrophosphatase MutT (NUDIX family) [Friedmanniella endophytica]|uniref:8-oxo-dGTP pyrophosphatase MutT (NUDIX family) n=1 Tax=Microlunatus kandeliicorticis TaxID=1759536 RepID=A0A7W3IQ79_9ACTN|nr:NUDIX hydrolase [Microlunatus kandeliicorticis]MBA8793233.1 8-oxo-dGTP pyrophosphatase MutT (NUDIX family) [Microlunatus kandeliicorticis]
MSSWRTRTSRVVYENRWITVREDEVVRPDGAPGLYGVLETRSPAVFVVAVTAAEELVLVEVDRYTVGPSLEVPGGGTDGEDPVAAARRELREETGLVADDWRDLGPVHSLNGITRSPGRVLLATGARPDPGASALTAEEQAREGITAVRLVPLDELPALLAGGAITDNEALGALLLGLIALGRVS